MTQKICYTIYELFKIKKSINIYKYQFDDWNLTLGSEFQNSKKI